MTERSMALGSARAKESADLRKSAFAVEFNTDQRQDSTEIACRSCGVLDEVEVLPGKPPHYRELRCTACGAFIRWMPKPRIDKGSLPATQKQLDYLRALAYKSAKPKTRREASAAIDSLKKARGWA